MVSAEKTSKPNDLYSYVIPYIEDKIQTLVNESSEELEGLKTLKLTRNMVKRSVMTIPYSVTTVGIARQLEEHFAVSQTESEVLYIPHNGGSPLTRKELFLLAQIVYNSIFALFPDLERVFKFLKKVVKYHNKLDKGVSWQAESGLRIKQEYRVFENLKINSSYKNRRYKVSLRRASAKINKQKQDLAFLPNLIHSLDAATLINFLSLFNKGNKRPLNKPIITVHDCFIMMLNIIELMELKVKKSFYNIYKKEPYLKKLSAELGKDGVDFPKVPKLGNYNIKEVLKSKYFIN